MYRTASMLIVLLAGCAATPASAPDTPASTSSVETTALTFRFFMLQGRNQADDLRILEVEDHPCGEVAVVRVPPVPSVSPAFEISSFIEVGDRAAPGRSWRGPTDVFVTAISGDRLGIEYSSGPGFWVDTVGNVESRESTGTGSIEWTTCPVPSQFEGSDFQVCVVLPDAITGAPRLITYERPCS